MVGRMGGCGLAISSGGDVSGDSNDGGSFNDGSDSGGALWSRTEKKHSKNSHLIITFPTSSGVSE